MTTGKWNELKSGCEADALMKYSANNPQCVDNMGWTDSYGDNCHAYRAEPSYYPCEGDVYHLTDTDGVHVTEACCACGGGSTISWPRNDSETCTYMGSQNIGLPCADILIFDAISYQGGWGGYDPTSVCGMNSGFYCDNAADLGAPASLACPTTCAMAPGSTYWLYYNQCMVALAIQEQCEKCPGLYFFNLFFPFSVLS